MTSILNPSIKPHLRSVLMQRVGHAARRLFAGIWRDIISTTASSRCVSMADLAAHSVYSRVAEDPTQSSLEVSVDTASVDTHHDVRDEDLRGAHFLDVKTFPVMIYRATGVTPREFRHRLLRALEPRVGA